MRLRALLCDCLARIRRERTRWLSGFARLRRSFRAALLLRRAQPARTAADAVFPEDRRDPRYAGAQRRAPGDDASALGTATAVDHLPFGDFIDQEEAQRFAVLPAIGAGEVLDVDWDALARELTGLR